MRIKTLVVGQLQTNCYVISDEATAEAAIVDPGGNPERILRAAEGLIVRFVVNTHAHFDHIMANGRVMEALTRLQRTAPELVAHPDAAALLALGGGASWFGLSCPPSPALGRSIDDGDLLSLGSLEIEVLHTPGHSPDSISLYCASARAVFAGDVLFRQGVGRYDLPGGDQRALYASIRQRLFALADDVVVYPGHGPATTIGDERRDNPFVEGA